MRYARFGKKSIHVWLPEVLVQKIMDENKKANAGSPYYRREKTQETYERILRKFFEAPEAKPKPAKKRGMIKT